VVDTVLHDICPARAVEPECVVDVFERRSAVAVAQTGEPEGIRLAGAKLNVSVASPDLTARYGACIVTSVAAAGFLQDASGNRNVNAIGPFDVCLGTTNRHPEQD
jgi:hypothetical protein